MHTQEKRSFFEIATKEYKLIILIVLLSGGLTSILFDVINAITYAMGLGYSELIFHAIDILYTISKIIRFVVIPPIVARVLSGQELKSSVKGGLNDLKKLRTWIYIILIVVPYFVVYRYGSMLIGDGFIQRAVDLGSKYPTLTNLQIVQLGLCIIAFVVIMSITSLIFIAYIVYMRGTSKIKEVFKGVTNREIIILIGYYCIICISIYDQVFGFGDTLFDNLGQVSYNFVMLSYNLVIMYITYSLYISISTSISTKLSSSNEPDTAFRQSSASERNQIKEMRKQQEAQETQVSSGSINSTVVEEKQARKVDNPFEVK